MRWSKNDWAWLSTNWWPFPTAHHCHRHLCISTTPVRIQNLLTPPQYYSGGGFDKVRWCFQFLLTFNRRIDPRSRSKLYLLSLIDLFSLLENHLEEICWGNRRMFALLHIQTIKLYIERLLRTFPAYLQQHDMPPIRTHITSLSTPRTVHLSNWS